MFLVVFTISSMLLYAPQAARFLLLSLRDRIREQFAHLAECEKRNITCIHTRQTDFIRLNRTTDLEETVMAAYNISEQHRSQQYLIFGDDRTFMAKLATRLKQVDASKRMFRLASGFGIAKRFERTLYYYDVDELMLERLKQIVFAFPRTAEKFVVSAIRANGIPEQSVGLSESMNGRTTVAA
ncbi:hypothetical protein RB195_012967 [Necator americanus]|uniref:Uncharacterized protein n=1 Tax=Necator americanus TaxID=51031 RepID=A0ABR1DTC0_NECAM